jgi:hypothetical protein
MKYQLIFRKIDLAQTPPLMSALGQKRTSKRVRVMSALLPKADIGTHAANVRFVPKAELNAIHFPLTRGCQMREGKRTQHMMPALLDLWFDFASTYS